MSLHYEPLKGRAELKALAKQYLKEKWLEAGVFVFIATLLASIGSYFLNMFIQFDYILLIQPDVIAFFLLIALAYHFLAGIVFSSSIFKYFRHLTDDKQVSMAELTKPFSYYSQVVIFGVISTIPSAVFFLVGIISAAFSYTYLGLAITIILFLLLIPACIIYNIWVTFVMFELGEMPLKEAALRAFFLTKKAWTKAFVLDLSFLGWYLIGMCACFIGMYAVFPYHYTTLALFYKNLKASYFGTEISDSADEGLVFEYAEPTETPDTPLTDDEKPEEI